MICSPHFSNFAAEFVKMKGIAGFISAFVAVTLLGSCSGYNMILKSTDYDAKYELAKTLYVEGRYSNASSIIEDCVMMFRATSKGEESVYLLADCYAQMNDWIMASQYYQTYYKTYPKGEYVEAARFRSGKCLFYDTPDPRLDPTSTYAAINELQEFLEFYPASEFAEEANDMIYKMYDRLVEKEMYNVRLYYKLGNYMGNNYQAGIITAQNALKDFPYTKYREDLSMMILRCKFRMAEESVPDKRLDRYRDTVDEYYAFRNEFPESKYMKEVEKIYTIASGNAGNSDSRND